MVEMKNRNFIIRSSLCSNKKIEKKKRTRANNSYDWNSEGKSSILGNNGREPGNGSVVDEVRGGWMGGLSAPRPNKWEQ